MNLAYLTHQDVERPSELSTTTDQTPSEIDARVGARLRYRRKLVGLSQQKLAESLGITFQQVQKYENGLNRLSAGRMYMMSQVLDVPVSYFFEDISGDKTQDGAATADENSQALKKEAQMITQAYCLITNASVRKNIKNLVLALAAKEKTEK